MDVMFQSLENKIRIKLASPASSGNPGFSMSKIDE